MSKVLKEIQSAVQTELGEIWEIGKKDHSEMEKRFKVLKIILTEHVLKVYTCEYLLLDPKAKRDHLEEIQNVMRAVATSTIEFCKKCERELIEEEQVKCLKLL